MTPIELKQLFLQRPQLTLRQIADYFEIDKSVALQLVRFWERRGRLVQVACDWCQKGCVTKSHYEWSD